MNIKMYHLLELLLNLREGADGALREKLEAAYFELSERIESGEMSSYDTILVFE